MPGSSCAGSLTISLRLAASTSSSNRALRQSSTHRRAASSGLSVALLLLLLLLAHCTSTAWRQLSRSIARASSRTPCSGSLDPASPSTTRLSTRSHSARRSGISASASSTSSSRHCSISRCWSPNDSPLSPSRTLSAFDTSGTSRVLSRVVAAAVRSVVAPAATEVSARFSATARPQCLATPQTVLNNAICAATGVSSCSQTGSSNAQTSAGTAAIALAAACVGSNAQSSRESARAALTLQFAGPDRTSLARSALVNAPTMAGLRLEISSCEQHTWRKRTMLFCSASFGYAGSISVRNTAATHGLSPEVSVRSLCSEAEPRARLLLRPSRRHSK
mmetsp:Transcript_34422/g.82104  ORF Transcript_34422/g.82104 Transcript_34422/m.82104 type:complete len:334 (-) Transcript_34422:1397-2398(-)